MEEAFNIRGREGKYIGLQHFILKTSRKSFTQNPCDVDGRIILKLNLNIVHVNWIYLAQDIHWRTFMNTVIELRFI
jgi:hypothetical protein